MATNAFALSTAKDISIFICNAINYGAIRLSVVRVCV